MNSGPYRYVLFLNEERTQMATCWPTVDGRGWRVERAYRDHPAETWGPPDERAITGDLDEITRHYAFHGLSIRELVA